VVELAGLVRARKMSPVELVRAYLARIERLDPKLNSFISVLRDSALAEGIFDSPAAIALLGVGQTTVYGYYPGDTVYVRVSDPDANGDPLTAETIAVTLTSFLGGDAETVTLNESGLNTGIFLGDQAGESGNNAQGWRFVVVEDSVLIKKLAALALPRYRAWMEKAPQSLKDKRAGIDKHAEDPVYYSAPVILFVINSGMTSDMDTPMVCQNIMLAARSYGIGSCWVFFGQLPADDPEIRKILELKEGEKIYGPVVLGYPKNGFPEACSKKEPVIKWA